MYRILPELDAPREFISTLYAHVRVLFKGEVNFSRYYKTFQRGGEGGIYVSSEAKMILRLLHVRIRYFLRSFEAIKISKIFVSSKDLRVKGKIELK